MPKKAKKEAADTAKKEATNEKVSAVEKDKAPTSTRGFGKLNPA
jgi:hypothetical protein